MLSVSANTEYNLYTIEYKLDQVAGGYADKDGMNFRFVNDQMNTTPTDVTVKISFADGRAVTDENADIWGFGFAGQVFFENGNIIAYTETPLSIENHVTLLAAFEKGLLSPARQEQGSFEELKERAFEGSDYDMDSQGEDISALEALILFLFTIVLPTGVIVWFLRMKKKRAEKKRHKLKNNSAISGIYQMKGISVPLTKSEDFLKFVKKVQFWQQEYSA
jgi:hypothetical protein